MAMTIDQAIAYIHAARGDSEKVGLTNMRALCARLGNPQDGLRFVHVAGTNGKGSTCACLDAMLRAAGYRVGLYTSPYLQKYNERIRLDGVPITDEALLAAFALVQPQVEALRAGGVRPTAFEIGTALALVAFRQAGVDWAVMEVGLGGRLDPTNIITPQACAIATIGLDHMHILGETLAEIAAEKAGIIKPGVPVVTAPAAPEVLRVYAERTLERGAPWRQLVGNELVADAGDHRRCALALDGWALPDLSLNLPGAHQLGNAALALAVIAELRRQGVNVPDDAVRRGLATVRWPGRLESFAGQPTVLLDGAHNAQGAQALAAYMATLPAGQRRVLLCGVLEEKISEAMLDALATLAERVVTTAPPEPRALPAAGLAARFAQRGRLTEPCPNIAEALALAKQRAGGDGLVIVAGSLYLVGAVRALLTEGNKGETEYKGEANGVLP